MPTNRTVHKWTAKDREYLIILKLKYTRKCIARIFNHLLARTLIAEGFSSGLSAPALDAQYQEIRVGGKGHDLYAEICGLSEARMEIEYGRHLRDIKATARTLGLTLEPLTSISRRTAMSRPSRPGRPRTTHLRHRQRSHRRETSPGAARPREITSLRRQQFATQIQPFLSTNTPVRNTTSISSASSHNFGGETISPTLRITHDFNGNKAQQRPLLLFRSTDNPQTFRARRFRNNHIHVPKPDPFNSKEYRTWAIPHLERDRKYPSRFLSFAQSASNAIGRIETARSEDIETKKFLAIFSFNDVEQNATRNFGPGAGPHLAKMLLSKGEVSHLPKGYTGGGEWLAYGFVDCEPLAVLDAAEAIKLARAIRLFKTGDVAALSDVRNCLQDVPLLWREAVAYVILRSYCASKLPEIGQPAYKQMMQMIITGCTEPTAELLDFSRLSVAESDGEYEVDEEESTEMITPGQSLVIGQPAFSTSGPLEDPIQVPAQSTLNLSPMKMSTVRKLNSFNNRLSAARRPEKIAESTPLWSPDPSVAPGPSQEVPKSPSDQTVVLRQHEIDNVNDEDQDWDFVNDDLEDFFATSFPSAAKRAEHLKVALTQHALPVTGFDEETEDDVVDEDYVIPSIEVDSGYNAIPSNGRGGLLRGLTAHAASESPALETPSKPPRQVAKLPPRQDLNVSAKTNSQVTSTKRTPKSNTFQAPKSTTASRVRPVSFQESRPVIDLTKLDSVQARGTITSSKPSGHRTQRSQADPKPSTTVRTKVPVIVRKTIIDYSV